MPVYLAQSCSNTPSPKYIKPLTSGNVTMKNEPLRIEPANSKTPMYAMPVSFDVVSFK